MTGLLDFLFPPICVCCDTKLVQGEIQICTTCFSSFPETDPHNAVENETVRRLIDKTTIAYGLSLYKLRKNSLLERALFAMKYKNQPKIGEIFGQQYGNMLCHTSIASAIDGIVPIPLHPKRLRTRGYNQSVLFAKGLAESLNLPLYVSCVERVRNTPSQTKKTKEARIINLQNAFAVTQPDLIADKHLLLVDDILTTGATLASCTKEFLTQGVAKISIATIAVVEE